MKTISPEGIFKYVPLAGYGDRNGKPSTGVHDSIFVKAVALKTGLRDYSIYKHRSSDKSSQYN